MTKTHLIVCIMIIRLLRIILSCIVMDEKYTINTTDILKDSSDLIYKLDKMTLEG